MVALLFLCAVLLSGCTHSSSAEPGAVTVALDQNPDSLDPRIGQNAASQHLASLIFSSPVRKDEKYQIVPDLASEWEMPDPRTYVFHLRHDVRFHDGTLLTSRDVQYTFRSLLDGTVSTIKAGHPYNLIDSVEAPDPYTVVFKLKDVYAPFLWNVAVGVIGVIPEGSGKDFSRHLIGSGPFRLVRYIQDQEIVLERNDSYFRKRAEVPILRFRIIPEEVVVALELRKGALDIALQVLAPDMVEVLKHDPNLKVVEAPGTNYQYMAFNLNDPVFRDLRVRQAFAYGIDREQILKYLWRGLARPAVGLLPPNNWAYNRDVRTYWYDPQRARSLLREAGYEHLTFTYRLNSDNDTARQMASIFQQQLRKIGVTMVIQGNEFATFFADVMKVISRSIRCDGSGRTMIPTCLITCFTPSPRRRMEQIEVIIPIRKLISSSNWRVENSMWKSVKRLTTRSSTSSQKTFPTSVSSIWITCASTTGALKGSGYILQRTSIFLTISESLRAISCKSPLGIC